MNSTKKHPYPVLGVDIPCWLSVAKILEHAVFYLGPESTTYKYNFPSLPIKVKFSNDQRVCANISIDTYFSLVSSEETNLRQMLEFIYGQARLATTVSIENTGTSPIEPILSSGPLVLSGGVLSMPQSKDIRVKIHIKTCFELCQGKPSFDQGRYKDASKQLAIVSGDVIPCQQDGRIILLELKEQFSDSVFGATLHSRFIAIPAEQTLFFATPHSKRDIFGEIIELI